jgi:hypothetical protein
MENHLGHSIKTLRTDCGGEYTNNKFRNFCSTSGIVHQFTCPHTSQQNGVAERKHRHIVDMALTLISQSSLPFQYWPYAFSTAIFLINRLPSLHRLSFSPWESFFSKQPISLISSLCYSFCTTFIEIFQAERKSIMKAKLEKAVGVIIPILKIALVSVMQVFMTALAVEIHKRVIGHLVGEKKISKGEG